MRRIWILALNDLRRTASEKTSFFWMLVLPVAMMWFFGNLGGGGSGPPKVSLTVVDHDGGWLARRFVEQLEAPRVELREKTAAEAAAGKETRLLALPEGFTEKVLAGEQQKLHIEKQEKADADFSLAADVHVVRAITRTLGLLLEMNDEGKLPPKIDSTAAEAEFDRLAARPRQVSLEVATAGKGTPVPAGTVQSVPGILTMTVIMMTVIFGGALLTFERQEGMLRRQVTLPISRRDLFLGKLGGRVLLAGIQIVVLLAVGRLVFRVGFGSSPAGLAVLLLSYTFAVAGLATLFGAIFQTAEQASAIGWIASMVMSSLGGCWWPSEIMPRWLSRAAHVFPTAWAMDGFHALISFGRGIESVALPAGVLLLFGIAFTALGARWLK